MLASGSYRELGEAAWSWVLGQVRGDDGPWLPRPCRRTTRRRHRPGTATRCTPGSPGSRRSWPRSPAPRADRRRAGPRDPGGGSALGPGEHPHRALPVRRAGRRRDGAAAARPGPRVRRAAAARRPDDPGRLAVDAWTSRAPTSRSPTSSRAPPASCWRRSGPAASTPRTIATTGGEALLRAADRTEAGLDWGMRPGVPFRMPNYSHGTAGVAAALAVAGAALDRADFVDAAVQGARHLLAVGFAGRRRVRRPAHHPAVRPARSSR